GDEFSVLDKSIPTNGQMDLFSTTTTTITTTEIVTEISVENVAINNIHNTTHEYVLADTAEKQVALAEQLASLDSFCFDTETTGLDANLADIVGLSFSFENAKAYYVPTPADREGAQAIVDIFKPVLENPNIEKIGQNIKYDILLLARYGVKVQGSLFDTMLAHYLIDPDTRHGMDVLAENYLNYSPVS
ncbi:MAG TPA: DNA polymerase I, partial [Sphingobacterium sp.]|nr:DNA polymerase I [Sphingobacterium sp.]